MLPIFLMGLLACYECIPYAPPCGYDTTLQTQTVFTTPANRARTKLGVGEVTTITLSPVPDCSVSWSLTPLGAGELSGASSSGVTFTAHERASNPQIKAEYGNGSWRQVTYNVVEPTSESAVKVPPDDSFPPGAQGAGMRLNITVMPDDVSFRNVEIYEVEGPATNISGYYLQFPSSELFHHPTPTGGPYPNWFRLSVDNKWGDHAADANEPPPWSLGGFEWNIPVKWRVLNKTNEASMPTNRLQQFLIHDATGRTTVFKLGQSVTRTP